MPFDFDDYQKKCNGMTTEQLNQEWDKYTRQIAGGSTSTATSVLLSGVTGGVSLIGLGISAPRIHNARKKRAIIQAGLEARGTTHHTHAKDVLVPVAAVGAAGLITLGVGVSGAELIPATGGMEHSALDYFATHAVASGAVTYFKYKARELAKKNGEGMFETGFQDPPILERYGPQLGPVVHQYSIFGHTDEFLENQFVASSVQQQPQVSLFDPSPFQSPSTTSILLSSCSTTSVESASVTTNSLSSSSVSNISLGASLPVNTCGTVDYPSAPSQDTRSSSLPFSNSSHSIPRKQVVRTQSESDHTQPFQPFQNAGENFSVLDSRIREGSDATPQGMISDDELDALVATWSDEDEMMLLMKLELELRSPGGIQPLHRTRAVHATHARRPHIQPNGKRVSRHCSEAQFTESGLTSSPRVSIQLSDALYDLDEQIQALPPRHPSLPVRSSQIGQQPPLPSRSPSLPVILDDLRTSTVSDANAEISSSHITQKPWVTSPRQSYSSPPTALQRAHPQLKDARQDSGYYSTTSTPAIPATDVPPQYTPPSFLPRRNHAQQGSQSSISSTTAPPPPYYPPPPSAPTSSLGEQYDNQPATSNSGLYQEPGRLPKSPGEADKQNVLGIFGWQWGTGSEKAAKSVEEPVYAPVPLPAPWNE